MDERPSAPESPPPSGPWERLGQLGLVLVFLLAVVGGFAVLTQHSSPRGIEVVLPTATATPVLQVYLTGAVSRPGIYGFDEGDRVEDLLERAGGPTGDADLSRANLAHRLRDEDHIHIPLVGEAFALPSPDPGHPALLDLNTATHDQLQGLPGIGEVRAAAIVAYREELAPRGPRDRPVSSDGDPGAYHRRASLTRAARRSGAAGVPSPPKPVVSPERGISPAAG